MTETEPPPELPDGQESEPPDLRLALVVAIVLFSDLEPVLRDREPDLLLRLIAVRQVLRRLRALQDES